jgi:5-methylcytosine-specific restriction endonuclease McrA
VLLDFAQKGEAIVDFPDLAAAFIDVYTTRLESARPQMNVLGRTTLMEKVVAAMRVGALTRNQAIEIVSRDGFNDVVPRFHTLPGGVLDASFYRTESYRIELDDSILDLVRSTSLSELRDELESRWSLLETAFSKSFNPAALNLDKDVIYYTQLFERTAVTSARPVITGYQNGLCFYCSEPLEIEPVETHVDHVIPRAAIASDEIWNLVVAHATCNLRKSDNIPPREYIEALYLRNEYYIASNHPIKQHLIWATGKGSRERRQFLENTYSRATMSIARFWRPPKIVTLRDPLSSLRIIEH